MLDFGLVVFQSPRLASRNWKPERPLPRGELDIALDRSYRNLTLKPLKIHDRHSSPTLGNFLSLPLVSASSGGGSRRAKAGGLGGSWFVPGTTSGRELKQITPSGMKGLYLSSGLFSCCCSL
jgi:hypothetical protein